MEEVLVIGGGGFVGTYLVKLLRENGNPVRILSRSAGVGQQQAGVRYLRGEVADREAVREAVNGVGVVFDLSLGARGTRAEMERDYVQGSRNVAEACQEFGVRRLIYASTTAALDFGLNKTIDESHGTVPNPEEIPGFYHLGKIMAEQILLEMHAKTGLPAVILRPAIIMGRGGKLCHSGLGTWRDDNCCLVVGKGEHPLPFVLVQDVASAFFLAMNAPGVEGRTFNIVGDVRPSAKQMIAYIRQRSRRNFRIYTQNLYGLQATALLKYFIKRAVGKQADRPSWRSLKADQVLTQIDCSAAKRLLNWKPVSDLETFLREAVDPHIRPVPPGDLRLANDSLGSQTLDRSLGEA